MLDLISRGAQGHGPCSSSSAFLLLSLVLLGMVLRKVGLGSSSSFAYDDWSHSAFS